MLPSSIPGGNRDTHIHWLFRRKFTFQLLLEVLLSYVIQKSCFNQLIGQSYIFPYKLCCWIHSPISPGKSLVWVKKIPKNSKTVPISNFLCFFNSSIYAVRLLERQAGDCDWYCKTTALEKGGYGSFYQNWKKIAISLSAVKTLLWNRFYIFLLMDWEFCLLYFLI